MISILVLVLFLLTAERHTRACTIFMVEKDGIILVGNNEDYNYPFTAVWFIPASEDKYGRICFGFDFGDNNFAATGGMNDQGLFVDGSSTPPTGWTPDKTKETFKNIVEAYILANFANVEEALKWFEEVNITIMARAKFLLADKSGASAVVEWGKGKLQIIRKNGEYQISTNFVQSNYDSGDYPCYRYNAAEKILKDSDSYYSVELIRKVLSATHFEGNQTATLFSNIYDLKNGDVYIYNFHNFEDVVRFNLIEELAKGRKEYALPGLFPEIPYAQHRFIPQSVRNIMLHSINKKGLENTIKELSEVKRRCLTTFATDYTESIVNGLGYNLLEDDRIEDAIEIFKYNVSEYPQSANAFDSMGEAYMINGDKELAIQNYNKSLELNPNNTNAVEMLKKIENN